ncbi:hypothetical protein Lfu02_16950 [Longispora fulva]|uniref:Uncharacterized protein n=1 Tax=Longispora fulva TaxID=619741 RepID=A0A8J7KZ63_9ACTN|nr:hypothetical protein [Longispora fulva]MBG6140297.1 hypothetical protein [Longispora fulva]GIG57323.1 hypothetical protein Lfu02_16950 [Longispora fulva]
MPTTPQITDADEAHAVLRIHQEDDDGHCAACLLDGVAVRCPCYARIEAVRYLDRAGLLPC